MGWKQHVISGCLIKSDAQTIPIIAMTANAFDEDVEKITRSGYERTFGKAD